MEDEELPILPIKPYDFSDHNFCRVCGAKMVTKEVKPVRFRATDGSPIKRVRHYCSAMRLLDRLMERHHDDFIWE